VAGIKASRRQEQEAMARQKGIATLHVPASLTAKPLHARLVYGEVKEVFYVEECPILMEKMLCRFIG